MKLTILIFTLVLSAVTVSGAVDKKDDVFWGTLQVKVQKLTSSKKNTAVATVAGVKGTKNDRTDIYWKGKEEKVEISEDELQKFNRAMEYQSHGEKVQALKQFETFLQEFPNSHLHADGIQSVRILKAEQNPQPPLTAAALPVPISSAPATAPAIPAAR